MLLVLKKQTQVKLYLNNKEKEKRI